MVGLFRFYKWQTRVIAQVIKKSKGLNGFSEIFFKNFLQRRSAEGVRGIIPSLPVGKLEAGKKVRVKQKNKNFFWKCKQKGLHFFGICDII